MGTTTPLRDSGTVVKIWSKRFKRGPMDPLMFAELVAGRGIAGNTDQGGKRQITILSEESWDEVQEALGMAVDPVLRRANVLVRGIDLQNSRGKLLHLGHTIVRIYGEVTPCRKMEDALPGLQAAMRPRWRGGVFGEIVEGGVIRIGDAVSFRA